MESNGQKGRIHVSEDTAKLLEEGGKSHWLTAREDKIQAKGKGELQTYWVNVTGSDSKSAVSLESSGRFSSSDAVEEAAVALPREDEAATREEVEQVNRRLREHGYLSSVDPADFVPATRAEGSVDFVSEQIDV